jgi:ABC-2 type transport system permease protein
MSSAVLTKDLAERRLPVLVLGGILAVFTVAALAISAGMADTIADLTEGFPDALNAFIGADVPGGYVVGEAFNLIAPLALVTYAVLTGAAAVAGEEEKGTMDLLAAQPVTRRAILAQKAGGLAIALICSVALFGVGAAASSALFGIGVATTGIVATCVQLLLLAAAFGAVTLAAGAATGKPSLAAGVGGVAAAISYVTNAMLPLAGLDGWARLSPWHYYSGSNPLLNGLNLAHVLALGVLTVGALAVAFVAFERRDLKG